MESDKETHRCMETLDQIREQVARVEDKLDEIHADLQNNLQAMCEREFWEEYDRYASRRE